MKTSARSVLVLHEALAADARPDELDALRQVDEVSEALEQLRWQVTTQEIDLNLEAALERLQRSGPACVFNLVESLHGRGELIGVVPALLESAGLPFTGSSSDAINLSSQKILAKRWMRLHGMATPDWLTPDDFGDAGKDGGEQWGDEKWSNEQWGDEQRGEEQWIVKSLWEHASLGLDDDSVVRGRRAAAQRLRQCVADFGGQWFAERYIDGREFNISLLEQDGLPHVLPIAEMTFLDFPPGKPRIVGYAAKWDASAPEFSGTRRRFASLDDDERRKLNSVATECWSRFGLRGYARVDIRLDDRGVPWILEVNANPCLARDAGFVAAGAEAGLLYGKIIEMVLHATVRPRLPVLHRVPRGSRDDRYG